MSEHSIASKRKSAPPCSAAACRSRIRFHVAWISLRCDLLRCARRVHFKMFAPSLPCSHCAAFGVPLWFLVDGKLRKPPSVGKINASSGDGARSPPQRAGAGPLRRAAGRFRCVSRGCQACSAHRHLGQDHVADRCATVARLWRGARWDAWVAHSNPWRSTCLPEGSLGPSGVPARHRTCPVVGGQCIVPSATTCSNSSSALLGAPNNWSWGETAF